MSETPILLSSSSVYPGGTAVAFATAKRLAYDGLEVMVGVDSISADVEAVRQLRDFHEVPVMAIHAPCLLISQRVWGSDPWEKLKRSAHMAHELGASVVVVHPPFRWQREYGRRFVEGVEELSLELDMVFAVENMYPWRTGKREFQAYVPDWDPITQPYEHVTLDVSHAATSRADALEMAKALGGRLSHLHMTDGAGSALDEHLIPGRGTQPCAELLAYAAESGYSGLITIEVSTRKAADDAARDADLLEALAFTRLHFDPA